MAVERLTRSLVNLTVNRALRGMENDPERTMRNLVDFALSLTKGRFKRNLLEIAQMLLANKDSAYYTLAKNVTSSVERKNLKTFGVNMCYEGCTAGARTIRRSEKEFGFNIPWVLMLEASEKSFCVPARRAVGEAEELGVHVFMLFGEAALEPEYLELYSDHPLSAFVVSVPAKKAESMASKLSEHDNICVAVNAEDGQAFLRAASALRDNKRLFVADLKVKSVADAERALSDESIRLFMGAGCPMVLLKPELRFEGDKSALMNMVRAHRMGQKHPVVFADLRSDAAEIDRIISDDPFLASFLADGTVRTLGGDVKSAKTSLATNSLRDILSVVGKKAAGQ